MDSKAFYDKHKKYVDFYTNLTPGDNEYWGLGIENESYLMLKRLEPVSKDFILNKHEPERYSVNYWLNYKPQELANTLQKLPREVFVPQYINAYQFQNMDKYGQHEYLYMKDKQANPKFSGQTISSLMFQKSPIIKTLFEKNMIYDGDTFEFTSFNFYKTTVRHILEELHTVKKTFIDEINKLRLFNDTVVYPPYNYGFATFLSNPKNIAICNNGTYHINITLPTILNERGEINDEEKFKQVHGNAIRAIQWIEPLLVALYGSPDILHILNPSYMGGSQRLGLSRYIGLGTYDTQKMEKGKILDTYDHKTNKSYFSELHKDSPYMPPQTTGYDFNYNKFKKHGIELRILDYFPLEHLEPIINLLLLVCQHSTTCTIPDPRDSKHWNEMVCNSIKSGSFFKIHSDAYIELYKVLGIHRCWILPFRLAQTPLHLLEKITSVLHSKYKNADVCKKLSPNMPLPRFVDYNDEMKRYFMKMLGKN